MHSETIAEALINDGTATHAQRRAAAKATPAKWALTVYAACYTYSLKHGLSASHKDLSEACARITAHYTGGP